MNPLDNPSNRRLLAKLLGVGIIALNHKAGLNLELGEQAALLGFIAAYIGQSAAMDMKKTALEAGAAAASEVKTPADALAVMGAEQPK